MSNVTPLPRPSVEIVHLQNGIAIVRGGEVQATIMRDELPLLICRAVEVLQGK